jgi:hypothetical protein
MDVILGGNVVNMANLSAMNFDGMHEKDVKDLSIIMIINEGGNVMVEDMKNMVGVVEKVIVIGADTDTTKNARRREGMPLPRTLLLDSGGVEFEDVVYKPTVCLGATYVVAYTYGYDGGRI